MEDVIEKIMATKGGNAYIGVLTMLLRLRQGIWLIDAVLKLYNDGHYPIQLAITQF